METKYNEKALYKQQAHIYTEATPNPASMKFMLNFMLLPDESMDFPDLASAANSPLAQSLFGMGYITRVFFSNNFITLTQDGSVEWHTVLPEVKGFIKNYFAEERPVFSENQPSVVVEANNDTEVVKKIKGILDEYIKPAVEMDGGAIQYQSFNESDGVLQVLLQGSCSGCPSSMVTLKAGIQNLMQRMLPQVKEVVAVEG